MRLASLSCVFVSSEDVALPSSIVHEAVSDSLASFYGQLRVIQQLADCLQGCLNAANRGRVKNEGRLIGKRC